VNLQNIIELRRGTLRSVSGRTDCTSMSYLIYLYHITSQRSDTPQIIIRLFNRCCISLTNIGPLPPSPSSNRAAVDLILDLIDMIPCIELWLDFPSTLNTEALTCHASRQGHRPEDPPPFNTYNELPHHPLRAMSCCSYPPSFLRPTLSILCREKNSSPRGPLKYIHSARSRLSQPPPPCKNY
jgi:hypothetical protein